MKSAQPSFFAQWEHVIQGGIPRDAVLRDTDSMWCWATLSDERPEPSFRYTLGRHWAEGPRVLWVMLNPSTADHVQDDPTIRRCIGFSRDWGYGSLEVVNLYAWRCTNPRWIVCTADLVPGNLNDQAIVAALERASIVVAGWGVPQVERTRAERVTKTLQEHGDVYCVAKTQQGHPRHPLYARKTSGPILWCAASGGERR